jgi:RNA polymerase-binding protein DksA
MTDLTMTDLTVTDAGQSAPKTPPSWGPAGASDLEGLRMELEQQRTFRVLQLEELAATAPRESATAIDEAVREVKLSLAEAARSALAEIDAALARIERGRYGRCRRCGTDIPLECLQALPMASLCMPCQVRQELGGDVPGSRPGRREQAALDLVEEWGRGSFPASDPPANW